MAARVEDTGRDARSRLRWRCRRGMRELDALLLTFLDAHYDRAPADERAAFERLLELPDPELLDLLLGRAAPPEPAIAQVVQWLQQSHREPPP